MNRMRTVALCLIIVSMGLSSWVVAAQDSENTLCIPVGSITIEPPDAVEAKRAAVEFPHALHFTTRCKTCHHKWENDANLVGCMTAGCHDLAQSPKKAGSGAIDAETAARYYKTAFHTLCIGCHKQTQKDKKALAVSGKVLGDKLPAAGPVGCHECHPKE